MCDKFSLWSLQPTLKIFFSVPNKMQSNEFANLQILHFIQTADD